MNTTYTDRIKQSPEEYLLIQKATKRLEEILGENAESATAEWDRTQDEHGRVMFTLHLKDLTGEASGKIYPDDLRSAPLTSFVLRMIWGGILQARTHKLLKEYAEAEK